MMNNDRELLELAAKAAGHIPTPEDMEWGEGGPMSKGDLVFSGNGKCIDWSPLTDDGDALRLAVKLGLKVLIDLYEGETRIHNVYDGLICMHMHFDGGPGTATRRAIVRAAAAIGESMT